ncbi:Protein OPAQUE1 [Zea mays]|uniref:AUGMIN subunit 4 n=2 Tax=Zea mays TaxID=4577 RepID=A0A1D6MHK0_MAIZE|nr:AUGMIN subunit 4 [Zea mays]ONM28921.1 AUGMIN subunit 4 [Zea mays]ONM28923.1 AUGMIN subunit 4 [Zea mays]ONM28924.1 AUGMIN subunit 4 [Zea mays]ONM28925.1 AUGMIN subunit 4 [Zea mays]
MSYRKGLKVWVEKGEGWVEAVVTEAKDHAVAVLTSQREKDDGMLVISTVPGSPPKLCIKAVALENFCPRAFSLLSIAGLSGFC